MDVPVAGLGGRHASGPARARVARDRMARGGAVTSLVEGPAGQLAAAGTPARRRPSPGPLGPQPVRAVLAGLGITDTEAAEVLGCSTSYVNAVASGSRPPSLVAAARLARLVQLPIEECFALGRLTASVRSAPPSPYGPQPIAALLDAAGIGPEQAAASLGLHLGFVDRVLAGRARASLAHLAGLAALAGRPVEACFTERFLGGAADTAAGTIASAAGRPTAAMTRRRQHPANPGASGVQPVKDLLHRSGITHAQAAAVAGCTQQHLTAVVNGQERPSVAVAARLARAVGRPIGACFTGLDAPRPVPARAPGRWGRQPLRKMLEASGVAPAEAGRRLGIAVSSLDRLLHGDVRPSLARAAALALLVGAPIADCFTEELLGLADWSPEPLLGSPGDAEPAQAG